MVKFKKILWPIDIGYADLNSSILPYINSFIEKYDAEPHLLYVVSGFEQQVMMYSTYVESEELRERAMRDAQVYLRKFVKENIAEGVEIKTVVQAGHPTRIILDYADNNQIDLIVMGTQGRGRFEEFILGSVSKQVVKRAKAPVLTINPHIIIK